jgi:hypothetical protein
MSQVQMSNDDLDKEDPYHGANGFIYPTRTISKWQTCQPVHRTTLFRGHCRWEALSNQNRPKSHVQNKVHDKSSGTMMPDLWVSPHVFVVFVTYNLFLVTDNIDSLCGLIVRVPGYRPRGTGFDSLRYQIFWEVVGLEQGPLSLVSTTEELLGRKSSGSGLENRDYRRGYATLSTLHLLSAKSWR